MIADRIYVMTILVPCWQCSNWLYRIYW